MSFITIFIVKSPNQRNNDDDDGDEDNDSDDVDDDDGNCGGVGDSIGNDGAWSRAGGNSGDGSINVMELMTNWMDTFTIIHSVSQSDQLEKPPYPFLPSKHILYLIFRNIF